MTPTRRRTVIQAVLAATLVVGLGVLAEVAFLSYVIVLGRRGVRIGASGDLDADEREAVLPVA